MTGNAVGMTVGAGCYFKFGMSIPLAKVPFLRHFGGDRGAPGIVAAAGAEDRGRGGRQERETGSRGRRQRRRQRRRIRAVAGDRGAGTGVTAGVGVTPVAGATTS